MDEANAKVWNASVSCRGEQQVSLSVEGGKGKAAVGRCWRGSLTAHPPFARLQRHMFFSRPGPYWLLTDVGLRCFIGRSVVLKHMSLVTDAYARSNSVLYTHISYTVETLHFVVWCKE